MTNKLAADLLCLEIIESINTTEVRIDEIKNLCRSQSGGEERRIAMKIRIQRLNETREMLLESLSQIAQEQKRCAFAKVSRKVENSIV